MRVYVCGGESQFLRMRVTRGRGAHFSNVVIRETEKQGLKERYVQCVCVGTKREGSPYQLSSKPRVALHLLDQFWVAMETGLQTRNKCMPPRTCVLRAVPLLEERFPRRSFTQLTWTPNDGGRWKWRRRRTVIGPSVCCLFTARLEWRCSEIAQRSMKSEIRFELQAALGNKWLSNAPLPQLLISFPQFHQLEMVCWRLIY